MLFFNKPKKMFFSLSSQYGITLYNLHPHELFFNFSMWDNYTTRHASITFYYSLDPCRRAPPERCVVEMGFEFHHKIMIIRFKNRHLVL